MNFFYPKLKRSHLPAMLGITLSGGLIAGLYGAGHDWITYSISNEYFTLMKFHQFSHMDMGFSPHVFAAQIGFIAAGAVGLAVGWIVARIVVPSSATKAAFSKAMRVFLMMIVIAIISAVIGNILGLKTDVGGFLWNGLCESLGVSETQAFLRVALIHTAGYVGAFVGLVIAIIQLRRASRHS